MRRILLAIPILTAIGLTAALPPTAMNAQSARALYYESIGVVNSGDGNAKALSSKAQGGASLQPPSISNAQGSEDKPIYEELIERVVELGQQILKKVMDIAPPAFVRLDWELKIASILMPFALLAAIYVKLKERTWHKINYPAVNSPVTQPPSDLPAAAVSVLESRNVGFRTFFAAVLDMCQQNVLQVVGIRVTPGRTREGKNYAGQYEHIYRGKYIYLFVPKGVPQFEWERRMLNWMPKQPMMIDELTDHIRTESHLALIGRQVGEHLRYRGLFNDNPVQAMSDADRGFLAHFLGAASVCIGVGLLSHWLLTSWVSWPPWANIAGSVAGGIVCSIIYAVVVEPSRIGHIPPTRVGIMEISRWLALKESLPRLDPSSDADHLDSLLPYAIAFDKAERWLKDSTTAPSWFDAINLRTYESGVSYGKMPPKPQVPFSLRTSPNDRDLIPDRDEAFHAFMSAKDWNLWGRSGRAAEAAVRKQNNPDYAPPSSGGGGGSGDGGGA